MLQRHVQWAAELAKARADSPALWVLADETYGGGAVRGRLETWRVKAGLPADAVAYFGYTEAQMLREFAVVQELRDALPRTEAVRDCFTKPMEKSLAWGYHVEAILLWWKEVVDGPQEPATVWIIEDDAGYSGELALFLEAYAGSAADLITHGLQCATSEWVWHTSATLAFLHLAAPPTRLRCAEHVQRFSNRLLRVLHRHSDRQVSAWSEMSVPTLASSEGLRLEPLRAEHVGAVFTYHGKVPRAMWDVICQREDSRHRWWHALKW